MNRIHCILAASLCLLLLTDCCKQDEEQTLTKGRTVLIYFEANNNLYGNACTNIDSILVNSSANVIGEGNELLIYLNSTGKRRPRLLKVVPGNSSTSYFAADTVLLKEYERGNTLTSSFMGQVLSDAHTLSKNKQYALVLWSHGEGWLPKNSLTKTKASAMQRSAHQGKTTKWFGLDYSYNALDINELKTALEPFEWEYILLDACFGGSIEMLYELRDCCRYWGGSPTEIMEDGFPYGSILSYLFEKDTQYGVIQACKTYMDTYYNDPYYPSASMAAVDMQAIDSLAVLAANLTALSYPGKIQMPEFDSIQVLDNETPAYFYDFKSYMASAVGMYGLDSFPPSRQDTILSAYNAFCKQLDETLLYTSHTPSFYSCLRGSGSWINIKHPVCGLSSYIPRTDYQSTIHQYLNDSWYQTSWAKALGVTKP